MTLGQPSHFHDHLMRRYYNGHMESHFTLATEASRSYALQYLYKEAKYVGVASSGPFITDLPFRKWKPAPLARVVPFEPVADDDELARMYDELSQNRETAGGRTASPINHAPHKRRLTPFQV